jgi:hypothetical protein
MSQPALVALLASSPDGSGWVGSWTPGIGDPTVVGWLTVVAYLAAAVYCYRLRARFSANADSLRRRERRFWGLLSGILFFLCANKQLDLQTAMTEFLRACAKEEGWYGIRQTFQLGFIIAMALSLPVVAGVIFRAARRFPLSTRLAGVGIVTIAVFIFVRASSFHHIDRLLGERFLFVRMNWILELGGIAIVLASARRRWHELDRGPFAR